MAHRTIHIIADGTIDNRRHSVVDINSAAKIMRPVIDDGSCVDVDEAYGVANRAANVSLIVADNAVTDVYRAHTVVSNGATFTSDVGCDHTVVHVDDTGI